jgi:hypothetical protein
MVAKPDSKKNIKKRTLTEAQKKKVETYKKTQAAYNKKKKASNEYKQASSFAIGNKQGMESPSRKSEKGFGAGYRGYSSAMQEKAAMARNEEKRKPIEQTAKAYQKSRTKKKAK